MHLDVAFREPYFSPPAFPLPMLARNKSPTIGFRRRPVSLLPVFYSIVTSRSLESLGSIVLASIAEGKRNDKSAGTRNERSFCIPKRKKGR